MSDVAIKTEEITKQYGSINACDRISMTVKSGSIYGLIGRNGAGKTTFMRVLLGLTKPENGSIELLGKSENEINLARKKCGFIIEEPAFYEKMTAYDNLMIRAKILGLENADEEIKKALEKVNLLDKADKKVKTFSMGMRQILGVASAIMGKPELLILDEPVNGLDPIAIVTVRDILIDLKEQGATILISSHILGEVQKLCTDFGFILDGKLVKEISAKEIAEKNINLEEMFVEIAKGGKKPAIKIADEVKTIRAAITDIDGDTAKKADEVNTTNEKTPVKAETTTDTASNTANESNLENPKGEK